MLELDASQSELSEGPPGDGRDYLAAYPAPPLPRRHPVANPGGRLLTVDREDRAVGHQPACRAVDRVPGGVRPVAPVGAPDAPRTRRFDIDDTQSWVPPNDFGVTQHGQRVGSVFLKRRAQQE